MGHQTTTPLPRLVSDYRLGRRDHDHESLVIHRSHGREKSARLSPGTCAMRKSRRRTSITRAPERPRRVALFARLARASNTLSALVISTDVKVLGNFGWNTIVTVGCPLSRDATSSAPGKTWCSVRVSHSDYRIAGLIALRCTSDTTTLPRAGFSKRLRPSVNIAPDGVSLPRRE